MKYTIATIISLLSLSLSAQGPMSRDTIFTVENPENVVLLESPDGISIIMEKDSMITYSYKHNDPDNVTTLSHREDHTSLLNLSAQVMSNGSIDWEIVTGGICFGPVSGLGCPDDMNIKPWKSWEISWLYMLGLRVSNRWNSFTMGLGFTWRNYCVTSRQFLKDGAMISLAPFPENSSDRSSRLKIVSLNIPALYEVKLSKYVGLAMGPIFNFTTHSSLKTRYSQDGYKTTLTANDISARRFTIDIFGSLRYRGIGAYVRYAPMHALQTACGPRFSSLSAGIILDL